MDFSITRCFSAIKEGIYHQLVSRPKMMVVVALAALAGLAVLGAKIFNALLEKRVIQLNGESNQRIAELQRQVVQAENEENVLQGQLKAENEKLDKKVNQNKRLELILQATCFNLNSEEKEAKFQQAFTYGKDVQVLSHYAIFLYQSKKWKEAEECLKELLTLEPQASFDLLGYESPHWHYVDVLLKQNKVQEAAKAVVEPEKMDDLCITILQNLLFINEDINEAAAFLQKIDGQLPNYQYQLFFYKLNLFLKQGKSYEKLMEVMAQGGILNNELKIKRSLKILLLAQCVEIQNKFHQDHLLYLAPLMNLMQARIPDKPDYFELTSRGYASRVLGRFDDSKDLLEQALAKDPKNILAKHAYNLTVIEQDPSK